MTFGKIEKNLRLDNGLTMDEVAKAIGINKSDISRYENEITKPNAEVVIKFAKYYGVTTDYLLGLTTEKKTKKKTDDDNSAWDFHYSGHGDYEEERRCFYGDFG